MFVSLLISRYLKTKNNSNYMNICLKYNLQKSNYKEWQKKFLEAGNVQKRSGVISIHFLMNQQKCISTTVEFGDQKISMQYRKCK